MQKGSFIGIDFGTTNTSVVRVFNDEHGYKTVNLGEGGDYPFSSIVAIPRQNGGSLKFGRDIKNHREELSSDYEIFTSMKSFLGTNKEFKVGDHRYSATEITTLFLKYIKDYISRTHPDVDLSKAGLSFPVDFSPEARRELRTAAENAGIKVNSFLSESTAAYFANRKAGQAFSKVMVLDWGGGTFDISILELKKNSITETAVFGERVGGDDIDFALAKRVHAEIIKKSEVYNPVAFEDMNLASKDYLISWCEKAKIEISNTEDDYESAIYNYGMYGTKSITVSVNLFNGVVEPIIKSRIRKAVDAALGRANLKPASIDAIVIVGGSSNLASYEEAITNIFKDSQVILPDKPQWSTAEGAALMQIIGGNFKLNNSLGLYLSDGSIFPILKEGEHGVGSVIETLSFSLTEDTQDAHFNFANEDGVMFERATIPTKGYLNEIIRLSARIDDDQIARIQLYNNSMGDLQHSKPTNVEVNKLTFYYDISGLK
ncbi:Hsp70 family protein [Ethanoligenens harbinense]|uniref:Heat shock protein 70 n=1 Tax=Ethanoligenens harbinense (strain DSM 18485 / JCM 12961 / CGMCC 1.5033 / YUAN-3) TaxID=663278 RepID=E6U5Q4_ETHHY|nr:Hsp70 family protein [Ethanoligenens harbinense]ADU26813.1 Heat shock protein 70 [Ethanoligenens harbinense YUAN-3]AVQ95921.1 Hsp70 family protein [Ethanoligenens harbinense YUAN-3]AYF38583.1 Hsp70 family protein [Ethanoligenens harbinense]AYF41329.1 Hsp70 family protein [Ethanoligenens harbinense]QCN92162.1 Hsp70 family protein [Ethanoligenens harbinense]